MTHPILGKLDIDPVGQMLGSSFVRFKSPSGIDGLASYDGANRLELLAVLATQPRQGQLREFIRQCKAAFAEIRVLAVMEPIVSKALERYEFKAGKEPPDGIVWTWRRDAPKTSRDCA